MSAVYEIVVACHIGANMERHLGLAAVDNRPTGEAVLASQPLDQAGLHGLLGRLRDLNIEIVVLRRMTDG